MIADTRITRARVCAAAPQSAASSARPATTAVDVPAGLGTSRANGTCWRKMMTAMPRVNPSMTGHGM